MKKKKYSTHFRRRVVGWFGIGSNKMIGAAGGGRRELRRGGSEELFENGHEEKHGDENGGGHEAERDCIHGVVKVAPLLVFC